MTGSADHTIKVWSLKMRKCEQTFSDVHEDIVWGVGFSSCGKKVVAGSEDGVLSIHSIK